VEKKEKRVSSLFPYWGLDIGQNGVWNGFAYDVLCVYPSPFVTYNECVEREEMPLRVGTDFGEAQS